jgi:hypothetical protein
MAKTKSTVNKSGAIREAYKVTPNATAKDIVAQLKGEGIEVSEGLVYKVKRSGPKKKPGRKPGAVPQIKTTVAAHSSNGHLGVGASIAVAKAAAQKVGGWAALKEIVDALA